MAKLGFIGLGVMGSQMVNRLLSKGHSVTGYNRTRAKAQWLVEKGMQWADSPRAVASTSDFIFAMVTNALPSRPSPKVRKECWRASAQARFSST